MGANDKVEATYHGRTPDTEIMRLLFKIGRVTRNNNVGGQQMDAEFNRWLEAVRAEAKAEALVETATELNRLDTDVEMYDENLRATQVEWWLRKRAEQIRGGS